MAAANLTTLAVTTRKIVRYSIYFLIFFAIARIIFGIGISVYRRLVPPKEEPPTVGFSKLTKIPFPDNDTALPALEFKIETSTGELPTFPDRMSVYFMPQPSSNLFSADLAKQKATALGFTSEPQELSTTLYRFPHPSLPSNLEINIVTGNFSISYNLASDPSPLTDLPPAPEVAKSTVKNILTAALSYTTDLDGPVTHEFLKVEGQNLVSALSLSEANLIKINLFRKALDEKGEYPNVTAKPSQSNVWFILSGAKDFDKAKQMIAAEYRFFPIDKEKKETYPIKSSSQSLEDLKNGKAYIASLGLNPDGKITIRKIYLAYYDPGVSAQFLEPVVVFEGDRGFVAYTPAVTEDYYSEE